jgi:hypothetical protein
MHHFLDGPADVLAVELSGTITEEDLDAIMDRADDILAHHSQMHVFVQTERIGGIQLSGLAHHLGRSVPMLGHLHRFGRVGVVADQLWMRVATRIESALLPYVSYRVFDVDKRDEALAWVKGADAPVSVAK